jgi:hypothetical protein
VTNLESSNSGQKKKIQCPQCKADITVVRPRNLIVELANYLEYAAGRIVLPTILMVGGTTVVYMSCSYGVLAMRTILSQDDFERIFFEEPETPGSVLRKFTGTTLIPWLLIFSRTSFADPFFPIIPMLYFVTQQKPDPLVEFSSWPPSAGLSFALIPFARAAYNAYYEHAWAPYEKRWLAEITPRTSNETRNNEDDIAGMEIEIGLQEVEEGGEEDDETDDEDENGAQRPLAEAPQLQARPLDEVAPALPVNALLEVNAEVRRNVVINGNAGAPQRRELSISISRVAKSIMGALVFPGISAIMGDLLRSALPASWTRLLPGQKPTKFLQTRWGRGIVGGCLFVVLKDAFTLYVRWKMAQNHKKRSIANYKKK